MMTSKANILIGVAAAALMTVPAMGQTPAPTAPPTPQDTQPGTQPGQPPVGAIIRIVPGATVSAPDAQPEGEALDLGTGGVTPEEAAGAQPTLVEPADGTSDDDDSDDGATSTDGETTDEESDSNTGDASETGDASADTTQGEGGNISSDATDEGGDTSQPSTDAEAAIERADGATTGVTDAEGADAALGDADEYGFDFEEFSEGEDEMAGNRRGGDSSMRGMDGSMNGMDIDSFARDVFEYGYRQGYVAGMTEMQMRASRENRMRMRSEERRSQEQRPRSRGGRVVVTEDADGNAIIMLPPGLSARDFLQQMQRRSN